MSQELAWASASGDSTGAGSFPGLNSSSFLSKYHFPMAQSKKERAGRGEDGKRDAGQKGDGKMT